MKPPTPNTRLHRALFVESNLRGQIKSPRTTQNKESITLVKIFQALKLKDGTQ